MKIRLFLLLLILCQSLLAFSKTFIVTSNADSGTGTLREAIDKANANGTSEVDHIHFNLPGSSEADRTILLNSSLPALTSRIVIDGSTQPSAYIGNSHARIIIKTLKTYDKPPLIVFYARNVEQLEFYGIYFYDTTESHLSNAGDEKRAIDIANGKDIIIGNTNKGNVFTGYNGYKGGILIEKSDGLKIWDNFFGISPYASNLVSTQHIVLTDVDHIDIGGPDKRNIIFVTTAINFTDKSTLFNVNIHNNNIYVYQDGVTTDWSVSAPAFMINGYVQGNDNPECKMNLRVSDNLFSHYNGDGAIKIALMDGFARIWHNWFGTDRTNTVALGRYYAHGSAGRVLNVSSSPAEVIFGDDDPALGNVVAYSSSGVLAGFNSKSVKVIRNSFKCMSGAVYYYGSNNMPYVEVTENTPSYVKGKSTPLAIVDVFLSDDCSGCSPEKFIGTTNASATGEWQFDYPTASARNVLVNAHVGKQSSGFTNPAVNTLAVNVTEIDCVTATGKISGVVVSNTDQLKWVNEKGETVSTELELKTTVPGKYKIIVGKFCTAESPYFTIRDLKPIFYNGFQANQNPSCGRSDGSIRGMFAYMEDGSNISYLWKDQHGKIVSNSRDAINLPAGNYTLTVSSARCSSTYGPVVLVSPNSPTIDLTGIVKTESLCTQATGNITNISVTSFGNITYLWKNDKNETVGHEKDLKDIPTGTYTLQVTQEDGCAPVFSDPIVITEINGIKIDASGIAYTKATCNTSNGSITGITTTGATGYKWLDAGNAVVATTLSLTGMPPGKYRLVASNSTCEKTTEEFTIEMAQSALNYGTTKILTNASCGLPNGKIEAIFSHNQPRSCFWKNAAGQIIGNSRILENQPPGAYDLYFVDDLGCTRFGQQYSISNTQPANINPGSALVTNDQCGFGKGQITAPALSGGQRPYFYEWKDKNGRIIGSASVLSQLKAGDYQLTVGDALECGRRTFTYTVQNQNASLPTPVVNDIKVCSAGKAVVQVMGAGKGLYAIYDDSGKLIETSNTGTFNLDVTQTQTYTVVMQDGNCQSAPATVKVTIENDGIGKLANAFSPNSDGQNDEWLIPGIINYPTATVSIYNRYGVKVFHAVGYKTPFNGRSGGADLPIGTYYYIIDLKRGCGLQKGSLTIIR